MKTDKFNDTKFEVGNFIIFGTRVGNSGVLKAGIVVNLGKSDTNTIGILSADNYWSVKHQYDIAGRIGYINVDEAMIIPPSLLPDKLTAELVRCASLKTKINA
jgi:hypothetical protein